MNQEQLDQASQLGHQFEQSERRSDRIRVAFGLGFAACGVAAGALLATGTLDEERFAQEVPFSPFAQDAVNSVDDVLGTAGSVAVPAVLLGIAGVKIGSRYSSRLRSIDKRSSQELSDDGHGKPNIARRALRTVGAGSVPVVVGASAAVGALTAGIGTEITEGPTRPIMAFDQFATGETMITQYEDAMPMLESKLSQDLTSAVADEASSRGIDTTAITLGLNSLKYENDTRTALTVGVEAGKLPEVLDYNSCYAVPVFVDKAARIPEGSSIEINGTQAKVMGEVEGASATNRIGIVMSQEALESCINKNEEIQSHALILDTDVETAEQVLDVANTSGEDAAVITKERYEENSEDFWESNVKPITNTLALVGLMTSAVAMGGNMMSRMLRNRRELAAKLAAGESTKLFAATEMLRSAKDGVVGSTLGVSVAAALTVPVNALESGMRAGLGVKEVMVGYAVGVLGSVGGTLVHIVRPSKVIDRSQHTRV